MFSGGTLSKLRITDEKKASFDIGGRYRLAGICRSREGLACILGEGVAAPITAALR